MLNFSSWMPPIVPGSLSSSVASTCGKPRSGLGLGLGLALGLVEGAADPDAEGGLAGVVVAIGVGIAVDGRACVAVGDAVTVALPQPAAKTAARPMPIRAEV
jgi:hypothetical protein